MASPTPTQPAPGPSRVSSPPRTPSKCRNRSHHMPTAPETPRRQKDLPSQCLCGIKTRLPDDLSLEAISAHLVSGLKLAYTPDNWQIHLIRCLLQGYDSILCAGTGYGKSLVFEALALLGGQGKLVVVISPLKALERDQVSQAIEKGIDMIMINEDTSWTVGLWKCTRTTASIAYLSPEMALSPSFQTLWKDSPFRSRLTAVVVDEAHCIDEWGKDNFRLQYRQPDTLRNYTSFEIPILACTATCHTTTFDLIWKTLGYGN